MQGQSENHPLMDGHELGTRYIVTSHAALNKGSFATVDFGPTDGASVLHYFSQRGYMHEV
jgi:hypothetical protein